MYGNGYMFLSNDADTGQYEEDELLGLQAIKNLASEKIYETEDLYEISSHTMHDKTKFPKNGKVFRTLLSDITWRYNWNSDDINKSTRSYLIVSPFDILISSYQHLVNAGSKYMQRLMALKKEAGCENSDTLQNCVPYNICYSINNRIGYDTSNDIINVIMLRRPCVGYDSDINLGNKQNDLNIQGIETYKMQLNYLNNN